MLYKWFINIHHLCNYNLINITIVDFSLGQSCNHVGAVLLKVDFVWKHGYGSPSCTSLPCTWKAAGKSLVVAPCLIGDMEWKAPHAERTGNILNIFNNFNNNKLYRFVSSILLWDAFYYIASSVMSQCLLVLDPLKMKY